jgi:hypothetical protein
LQHQKNQLVANVLGDEGFASSLGIDDLNFILNHGDEEDTPTPSDDEEDDN